MTLHVSQAGGFIPNQEIPQVISRLLTTQQAFPKSAILTLILSELSGSRGLTSRDPAVSLPISEAERETKRQEWTKNLIKEEPNDQYFEVHTAEPILNFKSNPARANRYQKPLCS